MSDHNLKYDALSSIQHSEIPPTTEEVLNAWNRGSSAGQGKVLLPQDGGGQGGFRSYNELFESFGDAGRRAGDLRRGDEHERKLGREYSELEGLDLDVAAEQLGPWAAVAYAVAIVTCVAFWIFIGYLVVR